MDSSKRTLPVDRCRQQICDTVFVNRVLLVIGNTGCGKSTRVPQFLQEELKGKVICSQPRRLAVVAVAKRVAEAAGCKLGGLVGYRIGQRSVASSSTRLLFTTAGLLLEDIRANGASALSGCKCVVFDEVHERSVESDLSLECIHQLMVSNKALSQLKLVLMSATADVERFKQHFRDLAVKLDVINISDSSMLLRNVMAEYEVEEKYLNHVVTFLSERGPAEHQQRHAAVLDRAAGSQASEQVGPAMLQLAADLVMALHTTHRTGPEAHHVVLVFLPTYKALEFFYQLLRTEGAGMLDVYALHSSLDTDECVRNMEAQVTQAVARPGEGSVRRRKVIIATGIAESSITIQGVAWVIDTCVTNEVAWSEEKQLEAPSVVWASHSQCNQRKGRTGRTGRGTVYRLMVRNQYMHLDRFERPAMLLKPLRREALMLMSAADKSIRDVKSLFSRCMDPPPAAVVAGALKHLHEITAIESVTPARWQTTPYGRLLASMPLSLDQAVMVVRGGQAGLLWEAAVLASIHSATPYPIKQPFGDDDRNRFVREYLSPSLLGERGDVSDSSRMQANLAAYEFWQRCWCDPWRATAISNSNGGTGSTPTSVYESMRVFLPNVDSLSQTAWHERERAVDVDASSPASASAYPPTATAYSATATQSSATATADSAIGATEAAAMREGERRWCEAHYLIPSALLGISENVAAIFSSLHRHRPTFISSQPAPAEYYLRTAAPHRCRIASASLPHMNGDHHRSSSAAGADAAPKCSSALQRHCAQSRDSVALLLRPLLERGRQPPKPRVGPKVCTFFASRNGCGRGHSCPFSHEAEPQSQHGRAEVCTFFLSRSGCRSGNNCRFLHERATEADVQALREHSVAAGKVDLQFEDDMFPPIARLATLLSLSIDQERGDLVLLLGDGDLSFSASLCATLPQGCILATTRLTHQGLLGIHPKARAQLENIERRGSSVEFGINATCLEATSEQLPWGRIRHVVWNFPHNGVEEDQDGNRRLVAAFFSSLSRLAVKMQWQALAESVGVPSFSLAPGGHCGLDRALGSLSLVPRSVDRSPSSLRNQSSNRAPTLHLTLCNDQYGRWGLDMLARESFWFMRKAETFCPNHYPGYSPRRCPAEAVQRAETGQAFDSTVAEVSTRRKRSEAVAEDDGFEPEKSVTYGFQLVWPQPQ